jgi:glycosyltransferase involved in cell wall biosynthesis
MKIIVLAADLFHGGSSVVGQDVSRGMALRGHQVLFISAGKYDRSFFQDGYEVKVLGQERPRPFYQYINPFLMSRLLGVLAEFGPDLMHVHSINLRSFSLASLLLSRQHPMVWTLHDLWAVCMTGWPEAQDCEGTLRQCRGCSSWPRALVKANRILKRSIYGLSPFTVVTPSKWLADLFHRSSLSHKTAHVIPNAIDTNLFTPEEDRKQYRANDSKERTILFCGGRRVNGRSPAVRKGWEYLVEAVCILTKKRNDFQLLYTGDPLDLPPHFPTRVIFTGVVDRKEMQRYYNAADIFVLPTLADNSPLTILEAMACKTPVIATAVGGIPEIVRHGHTGLLSPPRDAESLAICIDASFSKPSHAAEMAERAYESVMKNFSMEQMLDRYESIYSQTISAVGRHLRIAS